MPAQSTSAHMKGSTFGPTAKSLWLEGPVSFLVFWRREWCGGAGKEGI